MPILVACTLSTSLAAASWQGEQMRVCFYAAFSGQAAEPTGASPCRALLLHTEELRASLS